MTRQEQNELILADISQVFREYTKIRGGMSANEAVERIRNIVNTDPETVTDNCPFDDKPACSYYPDGCGKCPCNNP